MHHSLPSLTVALVHRTSATHSITNYCICAALRLLWCVKIDFRQIVLVFQHEHVGRVFSIQHNGFWRLVGETELVMILGTSQADFSRQGDVLFAHRFEV